MSRAQNPIAAAGFAADFAARLRAARDRAGLTPQQAAERA